MFSHIIGACVRYPTVVLGVAVAFLAYAAGQVGRMPVDAFPEFAPPKVEVQTEGPGMTSAEVEELITVPMEDMLRGVPGVEHVRSTSVAGLSQIVLIFQRGTEILAARQYVHERVKLAIAALPQSSGMPVMLQPLSSTSRVMKIAVRSATHDAMDLSMIAYWTVRLRLMSVPGVANVPIWGERIKSLQVQVEPSLMRANGVTLDEVLEAASGALDLGMLRYTPAGKTRIEGLLDTPNQRLALHHVSPVFSVEHLAEVPIVPKGPRPRPVRLRDVADVRWDTWPIVGDAAIDGGPGLLMVVEKLPWANTLDVTRRVEAALEQLLPGLPGIEVDARVFRPATFIERSIRALALALAAGLALVVAVLLLFLRDWRAVLISVVAIPLSLLAAVVVLRHAGATINAMVLAGLVVALGSVVDDAVIDVENIARRLRERRPAAGAGGMAGTVLAASLEVRPAIWYATLIIALAIVPVFAMGGLAGAFFEPLAVAFVTAMLASMIVALTVTPALSVLLFRGAGQGRREPALARRCRDAYASLLARIVARPRAGYMVTVAIVAAGAVATPLLGTEFLPSFRERDFLMHWVPPEGTSHPEAVRVTQRAQVELRSVPGVRTIASHIGRAVTGDEPYGVHFTEHWVSLEPGADAETTRRGIETVAAGYPGVYRDVQTYLRERVKEVLTGAGETIVVRLFGPDLVALRAQAEQVRRALSDVPGLVDLHAEQQVDVPQIEVRVRLAEAARVGLKPGDVRRAAAVLISGIEVTDIHRDAKVYDVFVWTAPSSRRSVDDVRDLLLDTPYGGRVRLADVADVAVVATPNRIAREDGSRRIDVHANVAGRDLGAVAGDVERRLAALQFPAGHYAQLLGEYRERQAARDRLLAAATATAILIALMLLEALRRWRLAALIGLALPSALVGGVFAMLAANRVVSLGSLVGMITVLGIAARNGILLFHHYRHLEREEGVPFGATLVLRGAGERLVPILMTTLCTALALVPLVAFGDAPGFEIEHPMAIVILGGLATSTLLTLLVLPGLYLRWGAADGRRGPSTRAVPA